MHIASYNCIAFQIHIYVFIFIIAIVILLSAHQSNLCLKLQSFYLWMVIMATMVKDICHHGPTGCKILATWLSHFLALDC